MITWDRPSSVSVVDSCLRWHGAPETVEVTIDTDDLPDLFAAFTALRAIRGASDERIAEFARTWGVPRLCRHGLPDSHEPSEGESQVPGPDGHGLVSVNTSSSECTLRQDSLGQYVAVDDVREAADAVYSLMHLAKDLRGPAPTKKEARAEREQLWAAVSAWVEIPGHDDDDNAEDRKLLTTTQTRSQPEQRDRLVQNVNKLMRWTRFTNQLTWIDGAPPAFEISAANLMGAVVAVTAAEVVGLGSHLFLCQFCGNLQAVRRTPAAHCGAPDCQRAYDRIRKQDQRRQRKEP